MHIYYSLLALRYSLCLDYEPLNFDFADKMDSVKDVLGKWGKKAAEATKKAEDLAGNVWQHCMSHCFMFIFLLPCYVFFSLF